LHLYLASCGATETLPQHPAYPADVFTAALTTPLKTALLHHLVCRHPSLGIAGARARAERAAAAAAAETAVSVAPAAEPATAAAAAVAAGAGAAMSSSALSPPAEEADESAATGGSGSDGAGDGTGSSPAPPPFRRRGILTRSLGYEDLDRLLLLGRNRSSSSSGGGEGLASELGRALTAATDAIAWSSTPPQLFTPLFRGDATVSMIFRNFLLAQRVMTALGRTPVSRPALPDCSGHAMWLHFDAAVEVCVMSCHVMSCFVLSCNLNPRLSSLFSPPHTLFFSRLL
jgi:hypothetical protein